MQPIAPLQVCAVKGAGKKRVQQQSAAMGGQMVCMGAPITLAKLDTACCAYLSHAPVWTPVVQRSRCAPHHCLRAMTPIRMGMVGCMHAVLVLQKQHAAQTISHTAGLAPCAPEQAPPTPPVDPDNTEFVLFIRAVKFPQWYPLSVVKGGSAANLLVRAMEYEFGRMLYGKTLIRNIGQVCICSNAFQAETCLSAYAGAAA